jgi:predicted MFS family arabinose efflux permease
VKGVSRNGSIQAKGSKSWVSPTVLVSAVASLLSLSAFAIVERRAREPLLPPRLLANRNLVTAVVIAFLFSATFGSVLYFLSLYLQDVRGYDALKTGVAFLLPTAAVVVGSMLVHWQHALAYGPPWSQRSLWAGSAP